VCVCVCVCVRVCVCAAGVSVAEAHCPSDGRGRWVQRPCAVCVLGATHPSHPNPHQTPYVALRSRQLCSPGAPPSSLSPPSPRRQGRSPPLIFGSPASPPPPPPHLPPAMLKAACEQWYAQSVAGVGFRAQCGLEGRPAGQELALNNKVVGLHPLAMRNARRAPHGSRAHLSAPAVHHYVLHFLPLRADHLDWS